jgi:hypothetical protein
MRSNYDGDVDSGADLISAQQSAAELGPRDPRPAGAAYAAQPSLAEVDRRQREKRRSRWLEIRAGFRMKDRVRHPDGGEAPVEDILEAEKAQRAKIERETADGSQKHRRSSRWIHWIPRYVLAFDFCLLLYFFAGITNVDWAAPMSMALGFALVLAAMVTVLSFGYLAFTGHRLRGYKNHAGTVHHDELDGFTKVILGIAGMVVAVIAILMFLRMDVEVVYALGRPGGVTALVIATALAIVSAAANFLVIAIHALDGSDEVARLDRLSAAVSRSYARAQRMSERARRHGGHGL